MTYQMTQEQKVQFVKGYNAKVLSWNEGKSDGGVTPFHASSWAAIGYDSARYEISHRQRDGEIDIELIEVDLDTAQECFENTNI